MKKNAEYTVGGLKCDNPKCDYTDPTVEIKDIEKWIDAPCPKCGENLLTKNDYFNAKMTIAAFDFINSIPPELLVNDPDVKLSPDRQELLDLLDQIKGHPMFADAEGLENLDADPDDKVSMKINTHKNISVSSIKKVDDNKEAMGTS